LNDGDHFQVWPPQMDTILETIELPKANLDVDLATLMDICCSILDIPV
jgi:intraflagellar transport protein 46